MKSAIYCSHVPCLFCPGPVWRGEPVPCRRRPGGPHPAVVADARYWQYQGQPVLLLGGSKDDNLFQIPDLKEHLDDMHAVGAQLHPQHDERSPGQGFRSLSVQAAGRRQVRSRSVERRLLAAFREHAPLDQQRDIIVQIEVWDRFDYSSDNWEPHPYNPENNVNYTLRAVGLRRALPGPSGPQQAAVFLHHTQAAEQPGRIAAISSGLSTSCSPTRCRTITSCTAWTTRRRAKRRGAPTGPSTSVGVPRRPARRSV